MMTPATCPDCGAGKSHFYTVHQPRNGGPPFSYCDACHKRFGATPGGQAPRTPLTAAETAQAHQGYSMAAAWAAVQLWSPGGAEALAYLRSRGLTDATIRAAQLGYHPAVAPSSSSGLGDALYRADPDAYAGAILGGILGKQGRVMSMMHEAVTLPYAHASRVALLRVRKLDPAAPRKYMSASGELYAGGTPVFYQHDVLEDPSVKDVIVTEGEFKALLACQAWRAKTLTMPAVAHPGISYLPDALLDPLAGKKVYLCYDTERRRDPFRLSPGEDYTIRNGEKLTGLGADRLRHKRRVALDRAQNPKRGTPVDQDEVDRLTLALTTLDDEIATMQARNITVRVVRLPRPADVEKVDLDSFLLEHGPLALQALLDDAPLFEDWYKIHGPGDYRYEHGGMYNGKWLANWQGRVVEDIDQNDGIEMATVHRVAVRPTSGHTRIIEIPGSLWADPRKALEALRGGLQDGTWDDEGPEALRATKALSRHGDGPTRRTVYTCTGWEQIADRWLYLMPDGAIGATTVQPQLASQIPAHALGNHYALAQVKGDSKAGAAAFKRLLFGEAGAQPLAMLLAGHMAEAPLQRFMGDSARPLPFIEGESGVLKTALVRVCLSLYGPKFTSVRGDGAPLPKWESTYNALELTAFTCRDVPFVIDDYKQATAGRDVLPRFLHSYSEGTSRGRMTRDLKQQRSFPARGLAIITGEDRPTGDTGQLGRVQLCPVRKGEVNPEVLADLQRAGVAGDLAAFWRGFIQSIASHLDRHGVDAIQQMIAAQLDADDASLPVHQRTAGALRQNRAAWLVLRRWMEQAGHLTPDEARQLDAAHLEARRYITEEQAQAQQDERPSTIFLNIVRELRASGRAVLTGDDPTGVLGMLDKDGNPIEPNIPPERVIGFWHHGMPALYPNVVYNLVQRELGRNQLAYSKTAIWHQLQADGLLAATNKGTTQKTVRKDGATTIKVLLLRPDALEATPDLIVTTVTNSDPRQAHNGNNDFSASESSVSEPVTNVTSVTNDLEDIPMESVTSPPTDHTEKVTSYATETGNIGNSAVLPHQEASKPVTNPLVTSGTGLVTSASPPSAPPQSRSLSAEDYLEYLETTGQHELLAQLRDQTLVPRSSPNASKGVTS